MESNNLEISKEQYLKIARSFGLTKRETELGFLKVSGFSNRRIAYMFGISEQTVKNHFTHIYEKAWVPGRKEFRELFYRSLQKTATTCHKEGPTKWEDSL